MVNCKICKLEALEQRGNFMLLLGATMSCTREGLKSAVTDSFQLKTRVL